MIDSLVLNQSEVAYNSVKQSQKSYTGNSVSERFSSLEYMKIEETSLSIKDNQMMFVSRTIEMSVQKEFVSTAESTGSEIPSALVGNKNYSSYTNKAIYESYIKIVNNEGQDYWSPENTSQRIADMATSFGELWKLDNPDASDSELNGFLSQLKDAIDEGCAAANSILEGVSLFNDQIGSIVDDTYEMTMRKVRESFNRLLPTNTLFNEIEENTALAA